MQICEACWVYSFKAINAIFSQNHVIASIQQTYTGMLTMNTAVHIQSNLS